MKYQCERIFTHKIALVCWVCGYAQITHEGIDLIMTLTLIWHKTIERIRKNPVKNKRKDVSVYMFHRKYVFAISLLKNVHT